MSKKPLAKALPKLTSEGQRILQVLMTEYQMNKESALKLIAEGGQLFAVAILTRRKL
jgi:hypothetical protein